MKTDGKLMDMLTGYAASHQHPVNVFVHMIGIPTIMLGVLIPLSWITIDVRGVSFSLAHLVVFGFFLFYLTLDVLFAIVFLVFGFGLTVVAGMIAELSLGTSATVAAVMAPARFGRHVAQVRHLAAAIHPALRAVVAGGDNDLVTPVVDGARTGRGDVARRCRPAAAPRASRAGRRPTRCAGCD